MARLVVLGAGFAGLWAAIGAARRLDDGEAAEILVIDRNPYHNIRVRNYEVDLSDSALPLADLLDRIYPPRTGRREDLFAAAAPTVRAPRPVSAHLSG
jgi:flavin-dependent dehydrogenase